MKQTLLLLYLLLIGVNQLAAQVLCDADKANLLSTRAGAKIHSTSTPAEQGFEARNIIDNRLCNKGVWRVKNSRGEQDQWVVIELPVLSNLSTFSFNTAALNEGEHKGISAKQLRIELSSTSPTSGYKTASVQYLKKFKNRQVYSTNTDSARWVRITIHQNWSHPQFTELGRIHAYNDLAYGYYEQGLMSEGLLNLQNIHFDESSDQLLPQAYPVLDDVALILQRHENWSVSVEGHTDATGDARQNLVLSKKRALAVQRALINLGVAASRLKTQGFGEMKPLTANKTPEGRQQNRRVTFRLIAGN
jgi:outer membrane protein OmpA-like peptidoglycan-associated protein